jgi:hypothetical protein
MQWNGEMTLQRGHAYRFNHYAQSVLYIHRLYPTTHGASIKFSEIKLVSDDPEETAGWLLFDAWDECGTEADAGTMALDPRHHPIMAEYRLDCPRLGDSPLGPGRDHRKTVKVEWACAPCGMQLRRLNNIGGQVSLATGDVERLSRRWTVHEYNCGMGENTTALLGEGLFVTVGVEQDDILGKTWLVFSLGVGLMGRLSTRMGSCSKSLWMGSYLGMRGVRIFPRIRPCGGLPSRLRF